MAKKKQNDKVKKNSSSTDSISYIKDNDYILFSSLSSFFKIDTVQDIAIKERIMKEFWLGNLPTNFIYSFHNIENTTASINKLSNRGPLDRKTFILLLPEGYKAGLEDLNYKKINPLESQFYERMADKGWIFYTDLLEKYKEDKKISLFLSNLAVHIDDLRYVLEKYKLKKLAQYLPKEILKS